jgi:hypothetical protein
MEFLEIRLPTKMHASTRGIKAFEGKLSIIEAVDLKFTCILRIRPAKNPRASALSGFPKF